jgi:tRNA(Ile)-lysidine synthase
LTVGYTTLLVAEADFVPSPDFPALRVERLPLAVPGRTSLPGGGSVEVQIVLRKDLPAGWDRNDDPWRAFLDADVLGECTSLRRRREGDRFCPLGLHGHHKLVSELLINDKVPAWWRDAVPLLVRDDDEVMWVCGWRVDERARVRAGTSRVAVIRICEWPGELCRNVRSSNRISQ